MRAQAPLRILFVASRLASHLATGDRLRAYMLIKELVARGHRIDLLAYTDPKNDSIVTDIFSLCETVRTIPYSNIELQQLSRRQQLKDMLAGAWHGMPRRVWQFHSPAMQQMFSAMQQTTCYDVIHFSELGVAELVQQRPGRKPVQVFDLIDAVSMSVQRSLAHRFDIVWPLRVIEWRQLYHFERQLVGRVQVATVVSEADRQYLGGAAQLHTVPIGIDLAPVHTDAEMDIDLLFVGNMATPANIDAVLWFVAYVWPQIRAALPGTRFYIVGRDPAPEIQHLASATITVTGSVPDTNRYYQRAHIFVAPLRYGAGQKIKLLEAFAHGLAVVATEVANSGIDAIAETSIVVRSEPTAMADAIIDLLRDPAKRRALGRQARTFVETHFAAAQTAERFEALYYGALLNANFDDATTN